MSENEQQQTVDEITAFTTAYLNHINAINDYLPRIKNVEYNANTNTTSIYGHTNFEELKVNNSPVALQSHNHDSSYAGIEHTHSLGDIIVNNEEEEETLEELLDGKADTIHTHSINQVMGLSSALDGKASSNHTHDYSSTYAAINHNHSGYASSSHTHTLSDITDYTAYDDSNCAKKNAANTFTASQTIASSDLKLIDTNWTHLFTFGYSETTNNCGVLRYESNMSDDSKSIRLYLYGNNGIWMTRNKITFYQPIETNTNCGATINGATTITTTSTGWESLLDLVKPNLYSGQWVGLRLGKQAAGDKVSCYMLFRHDDTLNNRHIALGIWNGNENFRMYNDRIELRNNTTINGTTTINGVLDHPLQVYKSNLGSGGQVYISLGKTDGQTTRCAFGYTHDNDTNSNNNNFGWLHLQGYALRFFNNRVNIDRPLTVSGNTTINGVLNISTTSDNPIIATKSAALGTNAALRMYVQDPNRTAGCGLYHTSSEYYAYYKMFGQTAEVDVYDSSIVLRGDTSINGKLNTAKTTPADAFDTNMKKCMLQLMYPVGSIYQNATDSRNPNTIFGVNIGTWTQIQGYFLYCNYNGYTTGPNGGYGGDINHTHATNDHILVESEIPNHSHSLSSIKQPDNTHGNPDGALDSYDGGETNRHYWRGVSSTSQNTGGYGGGGGHNHGNTVSGGSYPPFYRVWTWYRSA